LEVITNELKTKIILSGSSSCKFECYDIIDLLPFILFENAIKYNYNSSPIYCEFENKNEKLSKIIVSNKAILPTDEEVSKLKDKHFRGENILNITGSGKGLFIADLICGFNDFYVEIETRKEIEIEKNQFVGTFRTIITTANNV
jgi:signal transduction histidine kinase